MSWKSTLTEHDMRISEDLDFLADHSTRSKEDDIGLINPKSGAGILARENGTLEGYADYGLGFRFSKEKQALLVFAPSIHVFTKEIHKYDSIEKQTYLRDEYADVVELLKGDS